MTQNLDFKSLLGENEPVKPPFYTVSVYKNLFSLKFETGSYLMMEKNSVHLGKYQISQHLEFSLET